MVRLRDWFESLVNKAGPSASWLEFQTGSDPGTFPSGTYDDQLALRCANAGRKNGTLRWI
jgi:hypothetical protein